MHGYRVAMKANPSQIFFVCRYCHQHKIIDAGGHGIYETTQSTTTSARHLERNTRGHSHQAPGKPVTVAVRNTLQQALANGKIEVSQALANKLGSFNTQRFRLAAVSWLVENNHPL
jgi:hypothetical protein